jgi:dipeptidyl aminopeptidase/acylaminoacyl peptidase
MKKRILFAFLGFVFFLSPLVFGQQPYKLPPKDVIDILDAPPTPRAMISPSGNMMLLVEYKAMPSISELAEPMLRLAGMRIAPKYNSRQMLSFNTGLVLKSLKDGQTRRITLPEGAKLGFPRWSFDGSWLAFPIFTEKGIELWAADARTGEAKRLTGPVLNLVPTFGIFWMPDNRHLLTQTILEGRGAPPQSPLVPAGPNIQETSGKFSKVSTYQDLLRTPYDEELFTYYATSQIVEIDVPTGAARKIGPPGIYLTSSPSPGGQYLLIYKIKKPFSYSVPYFSFSHTVEIWTKDGEMAYLLADLPVADEVPMNGVPAGPRSMEWQPLKPATLVWVEALDGGDPEKQVDFRDKILRLDAPFTGKPIEVMKTAERYAGSYWLQAAGYAFVSEYSWKKRWSTTYHINVDNHAVPPKKIFDLSVQDQYNDPGEPVTMTTPSGENVAIQEKDWIYLSGSGSSPRGDYPFLDKMNLKTMEKKRLFQSAEGRYEAFTDFTAGTRDRIIISSESKSEPPNYFLLSLKSKKRQQLTDFKDPAPQLTGMKKELIKYKREDGVELSGTLYLPPNYKEGERLPVVIWAYPLEYQDAGVAGQVRGSPNRFTFFRGASQLFFVTQGYAVLDNATMPVVGDPKTMNDTFVNQIVANAKAAIGKLDELGVGDPKRVAVGGHSYGAFMTANLLAHCNLFAAGIARSGAYNRTLTPFGFQSERRTFWEAPETYIKVSPFMHADKINEPILLIHGEADNNSGTFPIQSERLYAALKGFGATARLVMLPLESHGYSARESVLHVLAEAFEWLDKYVKNKK